MSNAHSLRLFSSSPQLDSDTKLPITIFIYTSGNVQTVVFRCFLEKKTIYFHTTGSASVGVITRNSELVLSGLKVSGNDEILGVFFTVKKRRRAF